MKLKNLLGKDKEPAVKAKAATKAEPVVKVEWKKRQSLRSRLRQQKSGYLSQLEKDQRARKDFSRYSIIIDITRNGYWSARCHADAAGLLRSFG